MANAKQSQSSKRATSQQPLLPFLDMRNENIKAVTGEYWNGIYGLGEEPFSLAEYRGYKKYRIAAITLDLALLDMMLVSEVEFDVLVKKRNWLSGDKPDMILSEE